MKVADLLLYGLGLLGAGAVAARLLAKSDEAPADPKAPSPGPRSPGRPASQSGSRGAYRTPLGRLLVAPSGFAPLPSGGWVNVEPLIDSEPPPGVRWARASSADNATFAAKLGGRLLTPTQVLELVKIGYRLKPCTLVHTQADFARMQSAEYAAKHDACATAQLSEWDGKTPLVSEGKYWVLDDNPGDHPGMGRNMGWIDPKTGKLIQPGGAGSEHHDAASYTDYSQVARIWLPSLPSA